MFKSVEYAGFEGHPELKALAERGTVILASEISAGWHEAVDVGWEAYPQNPAGCELTIEVSLSAGTGKGGRLIPAAEFADEDNLRSRCRYAWDRALGNYLEKRKKVWDEILREPAEV